MKGGGKAPDNDRVGAALTAHHDQMVSMEAKSMAIQLVMTGLLSELKKREDGKQAISAAFDFAADVAVAAASGPQKSVTRKMCLL
ncbi:MULTISPECIES: hypothetical protein [unclassified Mesorhizobium]|uniref:hypothetical protein n=1 Tax=unclassified Mesorhizobium TaxID=325217 RepID=UPI00112E7104|nr:MULTISPECIES: hypothetical protein [unclassified Mesorhizobium]TPJ46309.1 hypothetical protein FJ437_13995 [Mesorhizobium sp. B2-6-6]MBZ9953831.1 hypothetical protein [Mesorhizobium sp. BR1-1-15]MBZ9960225.1 hypothetical protein [Mesorhizobium sp. BR1-1-14]MCA0003565.1 hypothetical protein [Mesorhizobium sp. B264B2A]MCA0009909.1 hypothetical protein [Mesorhizobium sp. B264B1B]